MNKKAALFLTFFAFLVFIILTGMFFLFNLNEKKIQEKLGFGDLQYDLYNTYYEGEKDNFYYEKSIEYYILNTSSEFKKTGGINKDCNTLLKFNDACEPDYINNYLILFKEKLNLEFTELKIEDNFLIISLKEKEYKRTGKDYEFTYKKEFSFKKKIDIEFIRLNELKSKIKTCLQNNNLSQTCLEYKEKENNVLIYEIETGQNLYDNLPLIFRLDLSNTGVKISLLS